MGAQMGGTNYDGSESQSHWIGNILEVPFTVVRARRPMGCNLRENLKTILMGKVIHFRPAVSTLEEMRYIVDCVTKDPNIDHLEFMLHSSELMPGGSPYYTTEVSVDKQYVLLERIFEYIKKHNYLAVTLKDYYQTK